MNYKESVAVATECGMSHENADELVNGLTDIPPDILMNKIQEQMAENVKSVFANGQQSLNSTNFVEDTLTNMSKVFGIKFKNSTAGVIKTGPKKYKLDFDNENIKNKNITRQDYELILKDPVKNKIFYKTKEFNGLDPKKKPECLRNRKNIEKWSRYSELRAPSFVDNKGREIQSVLIDIRKVNALWENNVHNLVAS